MTLVLPPALQAEIVGYAAEQLPLEACGLVGGVWAGDQARACIFLPAPNAALSPTRFLIRPEDVLHVLRLLDRRHLSLLAIFHSHPTAPAYPSATDIAQARYPRVLHLICSLEHGVPQLAAYRLDRGQVQPVAVLSAPARPQG